MKYGFVIFLLIVINSKAQNYIPFPTENASWKVGVEYTYCDILYVDYCVELEFNIEGDIIVKGIRYHKLYVYFTKYPFQEIYKDYNGAFRNDTINKKVYFIDYLNLTQNEILLYDFSKNIGDTIKCYADTAIIDSIKLELIGNQQRKVFYLSPIDSGEFKYIMPYKIIEGIGSDYGIFQEPYLAYFERPFTRLQCFKIKGERIIGSESDCESIITQVNKIDFQQEIKLYPNPIKDILNIETGGQMISSIEIYDTFGRRYFFKGNVSFINFNYMPNGIYFIKIITNQNSVYMNKIIKN